MDNSISEIARLIGVKRKYEDRIFSKIKESEILRKEI